MTDLAPNSASDGAEEARPRIYWAQIGPKFPPFALQALVATDGTAAEGDIVRVLEPAWVMILSLIQADPDALHKLSPRQFEELVH
jgi:hypothetical protein